MDDAFPRWPPDWIDEREVSAEQTLAATEGVELVTGLRADGHVLLAVGWPGGRRYLLVDPIGNDDPRSLRIGDLHEDHDVMRVVDGLWTQALAMAKGLIDGDLPAPGGDDDPGGRRGRRRWGRG